MEYRRGDREKRPWAFIALIVCSAILAGLYSIYIGYLDVDVPTLAEQYAPTPTATRPAIDYIAEGDQFFAEGKIQQAIQAYERAIELDPDNDIPYIRQARLWVYTRDTSMALERAEQAVLIDPNSPENLAYYCRALDWEAQYNQAFDACSCAIETDPTYAEGHAFLAEVYADLNNGIAAQENAQVALDNNFYSVDAHYNMGYALQVLGRYEEAAEYYDNATKLMPKLGPLYVSAGRMYQQVGEYETAIDRYKQAIRLNPYDPEAYDLLGWAYYFNGEYIRSIDALEQSIGVDPNYVNPFRRESAWGHLGTVYYARQNFEEAASKLERAIEIGEAAYLRRARDIEIYTEVQTLTGPQTIPVMRGRFTLPEDNRYITDLEPVRYTAEAEFETEQTCGDLIREDIRTEPFLLEESQALTMTEAFTNTIGSASLNLTDGTLILNLTEMPEPELTPYEVRVRFWPNDVSTVAQFVPDGRSEAQINLKFEQSLEAPVEFYYQLGLAYTYMEPRQCDQAAPWLLRALEIENVPYSPAWFGLRVCPSADSPPTPVPTFTPAPDNGG